MSAERRTVTIIDHWSCQKYNDPRAALAAMEAANRNARDELLRVTKARWEIAQECHKFGGYADTEAARVILGGCSREWVQRLARRGDVRASRHYGGTYSVADLQRYQKEKRRPGRPAAKRLL